MLKLWVRVALVSSVILGSGYAKDKESSSEASGTTAAQPPVSPSDAEAEIREVIAIMNPEPKNSGQKKTAAAPPKGAKGGVAAKAVVPEVPAGDIGEAAIREVIGLLDSDPKSAAQKATPVKNGTATPKIAALPVPATPQDIGEAAIREVVTLLNGGDSEPKALAIKGTGPAAAKAPATPVVSGDIGEAAIREVIAILDGGAATAQKSTALQGPAPAISALTAKTAARPLSSLTPDEMEIMEVIAIMNPEPKKPNAPQQPTVASNKRAPVSKAGLKGGLYIFGPTKPGATLTQVAEQLLPSDNISVEQMMWALYVKNPDAFTNRNIANLKPNYILNVPELDEVLAIKKNDAVTQIQKVMNNGKRG